MGTQSSSEAGSGQSGAGAPGAAPDAGQQAGAGMNPQTGAPQPGMGMGPQMGMDPQAMNGYGMGAGMNPQMGAPQPGMGMGPQMGMNPQAMNGYGMGSGMGNPQMGMYPQMGMNPQAMNGYGMGSQMAMQNVNVQPAQFQSFANDGRGIAGQENIGLIMDVPLNVTVELGRTSKSISEILDFAPGTIIELERIAGEPIDVLVNGKFVAKGEVVVIEECFSVRIRDYQVGGRLGWLKMF